jgi:hypothetical protein
MCLVKRMALFMFVLFCLVDGTALFAKSPARSVCVRRTLFSGLRSPESIEFESRAAAFRAAKFDSGLPAFQNPDEIKKLPLRDLSGKYVRRQGKVVSFREYHFRRADGRKVIIQEHSLGHINSPTGKGNQGPHFNVRPEGSNHQNFPGVREHYLYDPRN